MPADEEVSSWLESRRLIIQQLSNMTAEIKETGTKLDRLAESMRDRAARDTDLMRKEIAEVRETSRKETNDLSASKGAEIADLKVRLAIMETSAKIWGGAVGLVGGAIASGVAHLLFK